MYGTIALLLYIITILSNYVLHCFWLVLVVVCSTMFLLKFFLCPCIAINVILQYNGGLLLDIINTVNPMLLPSGNPSKCHEEVLSLQPMMPRKRFDIVPLCGKHRSV